MVEFLVYSVLVLLAAAIIFLIVRQILAADRYRLADEIPLQRFVAQFSGSRTLPDDGRLGWLHHLIKKVPNANSRDVADMLPNVTTIRKSAEKVQRRIMWNHQQLPILASMAVTVGFIGTVCAMVDSAAKGVDPAAILGFGMQSTLYGLLASIPATLYSGATNIRIHRLSHQIDLVLEVMDHYLHQLGPQHREPQSVESEGEHVQMEEAEWEETVLAMQDAMLDQVRAELLPALLDEYFQSHQHNSEREPPKRSNRRKSPSNTSAQQRTNSKTKANNNGHPAGSAAWGDQ